MTMRHLCGPSALAEGCLDCDTTHRPCGLKEHRDPEAPRDSKFQAWADIPNLVDRIGDISRKGTGRVAQQWGAHRKPCALPREECRRRFHRGPSERSGTDEREQRGTDLRGSQSSNPERGVGGGVPFSLRSWGQEINKMTPCSLGASK